MDEIIVTSKLNKSAIYCFPKGYMYALIARPTKCLHSKADSISGFGFAPEVLLPPVHAGPALGCRNPPRQSRLQQPLSASVFAFCPVTQPEALSNFLPPYSSVRLALPADTFIFTSLVSVSSVPRITATYIQNIAAHVAPFRHHCACWPGQPLASRPQTSAVHSPSIAPTWRQDRPGAKCLLINQPRLDRMNISCPEPESTARSYPPISVAISATMRWSGQATTRYFTWESIGAAGSGTFLVHAIFVRSKTNERYL